MELTVADVARMADTDAQLVRRAIRNGTLSPLRKVGQTVVIDDFASLAWERSTARGRRWTPTVRDAAFDLAGTGETELLSTGERSRLRARLHTITAAEFAHAAGGLGGPWARYRTTGSNLGEPIGPDAANLGQLGIVESDTGMRFVRVDSLDRLETWHDVTLDAHGNLGVVERPHDPRLARVLLDTYLLGDSRLSSAAAHALEKACRRDG